MSFYEKVEENLDHLELYQLLENEMSKYKTLNHESIKWDKVYECSLELLEQHTIDAKIANYFMLSCLVLKNELCFDKLLKYYENFMQILTQSPNNFGDTKNQILQKKKIKNMSDYFIAEFNKNEFKVSQKINLEFAKLFEELEVLLECKFAKLQIHQKQNIDGKTNVSSPIKQVNVDLKNTNLNSLNDREYRALFLNLANELLQNNADDINAYAFFVEAMWGRIKLMPEHNDYITRIRYVDKNVIKVLLESKDNELEHIKIFMENLALNPFWIEGVKLFCEFLEKRKKNTALKLLIVLVSDFITKFENISKLRFESGELMCREEIFNYFVRQEPNSHKNTPNPKNVKKQKEFEQALFDINNENYDNSLFYNINALLDMAKLFEEKEMPKNAKIIYIQLKELMEKTLLKDYLLDDYQKAKARAEKK
ncbi:TssA family type VI secretion system protein [Campylobacter helveticus]|uniref:TssA family type VI secretion system protein n=1 Tax=Campylobacter helveticus TaxID=28898 RepID=UPI002149D0C1|nr:TssA family type VI secretion system protein [Campylobacter helveticus]MCR2057131.1 TssA family type VI secretion system protein [Campylobacter helveticus]